VDNPEIIEFFPPNAATIYKGSLASVSPNCLHVPEARNQAALDSLFQFDEIFYIFQFIVSMGHDIKESIQYTLSGLLNTLPPKTNWRFAFITPPDCEVDVNAIPGVETFLEGVTLYSAHLEIKK
jgi:hypothetical protein